ncbi:FAD/NAD(P)-binding protein [Zavarzinia compransoris]|uniref:FAD-dependent urate hydroxylase HpyO/Asp monooxygenase CreE-like FAD/NAD(P)-binding domain-containing protein n=1 Tax=Zavarzinia compransoris TaxID=1264899 RepID=A0A317E0V3_9PROT|nr:FAD/NAD(P)-binding protein [Zavarzinia compransoris]PWR20707.1 hypothetical protein DKG75_11970 [Zavarzinia compransoris]TDP44466.1 putative NAD(P)/FAD-binding protein YdhS [Zavarzinia compransoris]
MRIAIIGAGFTGAQLTLELLRRAPRGTTILLFERSGIFGPGLAYSTVHADHLLNVRAANMSAFEDDPSHFLRWLWARNEPAAPAAEIPPSGHAFVPRGIYGAYLAATLAEAEATAHPRVVVERLAQAVEAVDETGDGVFLRLAGGAEIAADLAVVAAGNNPPLWPHPVGIEDVPADRLIGDPWDDATLGRIGPDDAVIVLGTGLTTVDVVTVLGRRGHRGRITAISRRGRLSRVHDQTRSWPPFLAPESVEPRIAAYVRRVRGEIARAAAEGIDWRSVIDAIRPHTQGLWRALPEAERRRFLRHVRPWWEIHRHRMAPQVAAGIERLIAAGTLTIAAGRIAGWGRAPDGVALRLAPRGGGAEITLAAAYVVNCTGASVDYRHLTAPLIRTLLDQGLARPDPLGLGLDVNDRLQLVGADGKARPRIFALGPPTKSMFWEITAVPDIRKQGRAFALRLFPNPV